MFSSVQVNLTFGPSVTIPLASHVILPLARRPAPVDSSFQALPTLPAMIFPLASVSALWTVLPVIVVPLRSSTLIVPNLPSRAVILSACNSTPLAAASAIALTSETFRTEPSLSLTAPSNTPKELLSVWTSVNVAYFFLASSIAAAIAASSPSSIAFSNASFEAFHSLVALVSLVL